MREKRFFIAFDGVERGIMINCLNKVRNRLLSEGKYTDSVDELILRLCDVKTRKFKIIKE